MFKTITEEQVEEIEDAYFCSDKAGAYALLKKYAGIEARPYTAYQFYDEADNCIGDSDNDSFRDLLYNAGFKVIKEGE